MSTLIFRKKAKPASVATKKRNRRGSATNDSSDSEEDVVRGQIQKSARGLNSSTKRVSRASDLNVTYSGDRTAQNNNTNDSTRAIANIDGYDEAALLEHASASTDSKSSAHANLNAPASKTRLGPVKAPTNIRAISVIDYQPDVCKDYKQTGFCGFGDTCKFLHDRGDFKQGWQLDRDWEDVGKGRHDTRISVKAQDDTTLPGEDESQIPFACIICKGDYKSPIITKCGHYFCERCALERYKKTPACAQCQTGTGGLFSGAKQLKSLLAEKQRRIDKKRESSVQS